MMPTFIAKKKGAPKRWKGQVWMDGKMAAVKWFGSAKADHRAAIAWEEQTKKDLPGGKEAECRTASPDPYGLLPEETEHP